MSRRRLPVLTAAPAFAEHQHRARELAPPVDRLSLAELRTFPLLSVNGKTTVSLDMPISETCRPTDVCAAVCYGTRPDSPLTWGKCIVARLRNLRCLELSSAEQFVTDLEDALRSKQRAWAKRGVVLDFLRFNGVGDLTARLVGVVNLFVARNPRVCVWVVTRKFELAAKLDPAPNLFLQLSLDASTSTADLTDARRLVESNPRAYTSFLRTRADDDTLAAAIVFNEKRTTGLPFDSRSCPVDAGKLPLGNVGGVGGTACARCRKCFAENVLVRQRDLLGLVPAGVPAVAFALVPATAETRSVRQQRVDARLRAQHQRVATDVQSTAASREET